MSPSPTLPQWFGFYKAGQDKQVYTLQESQLYQEVGGAVVGGAAVDALVFTSSHALCVCVCVCL